MPVNTLRRYKRHYKLQTKPGLNKTQLSEVSGALAKVILTDRTFPQCNFSLEFPVILSHNHIWYQLLSVSGIAKIMHSGILITMPYSTKVLGLQIRLG